MREVFKVLALQLSRWETERIHLPHPNLLCQRLKCVIKEHKAFRWGIRKEYPFASSSSWSLKSLNESSESLIASFWDLSEIFALLKQLTIMVFDIWSQALVSMFASKHVRGFEVVEFGNWFLVNQNYYDATSKDGAVFSFQASYGTLIHSLFDGGGIFCQGS